MVTVRVFSAALGRAEKEKIQLAAEAVVPGRRDLSGARDPSQL